MKVLNTLLVLFGLISISSCSLETPEKRIREAEFNDRPAVIADLRSKGKITPETAQTFYAQWKSEAQQKMKEQEAFNRWYRQLTPQQQAQYQQARMQMIGQVMQAQSNIIQSAAISNAALDNSINSSMDRYSYDQRTRAIEAPKYYYHNVQGTIYNR